MNYALISDEGERIAKAIHKPLVQREKRQNPHSGLYALCLGAYLPACRQAFVINEEHG